MTIIRREDRPGEVTFTARMDESVAGWGTICIGHPQSEAYISSIRVFPAFRRQGIATQLMQHMEREAQSRGCTSMMLMNAGGDRSRGLYLKCGFVDVAGPSGTDLNFMRKESL